MELTRDEALFSELVNQPKSTIAKLTGARNRHLRIRRRDAEDLVLTTAGRAEQEHEVVSATTALFTALMRSGSTTTSLAEAVPDAFPWCRFLPTADVEAFTGELVDTLRATEAVDNPAPVVQVLESWRHTAEVYADPELLAALRTEPADHGPATEPPRAT